MQSLAGQMPGHLCARPVQNGFLSCPTQTCGRQQKARQICSAQRGGQASMAKVSAPTPYKCTPTFHLPYKTGPLISDICRRNWMIDSSGILQMLAGCESSLAKTKTVHTHPKFPSARPQIDRHAASISGKLSHSELVSMVCPGEVFCRELGEGRCCYHHTPVRLSIRGERTLHPCRAFCMSQIACCLCPFGPPVLIEHAMHRSGLSSTASW